VIGLLAVWSEAKPDMFFDLEMYLERLKFFLMISRNAFNLVQRIEDL